MRAVIRVDGSRLERYLERAKGDGRVAAARALNRTMQTVQTRIAREVAADTGLPVRGILRATHLVRAGAEHLTAVVTLGTPRIVIADRAPSDEGRYFGLFFRGRQTAKGVSYRIGRRGRGFLRSAFLTTMRSGHRGMFVRLLPPHSRKGKPRSSPSLPIVQKFGPSLPHVARNIRADEITRDAERTILRKNLEHELRFLAQRGGGA